MDEKYIVVAGEETSSVTQMYREIETYIAVGIGKS
jgi:hypothetical protein